MLARFLPSIPAKVLTVVGFSCVRSSFSLLSLDTRTGLESPVVSVPGDFLASRACLGKRVRHPYMAALWMLALAHILSEHREVAHVVTELYHGGSCHLLILLWLQRSATARASLGLRLIQPYRVDCSAIVIWARRSLQPEPRQWNRRLQVSVRSAIAAWHNYLHQFTTILPTVKQKSSANSTISKNSC